MYSNEFLRCPYLYPIDDESMCPFLNRQMGYYNAYDDAYRNMVMPQMPGARWSRWEDLGGTLTSAPAVSSWAPN
ncbi:MAG TPA: carbohydrate-binding protein, partial [Clostridium sp.]|nr:carbohydrate-binding protein [Clostridium sp.]